MQQTIRHQCAIKSLCWFFSKQNKNSWTPKAAEATGERHGPSQPNVSGTKPPFLAEWSRHLVDVDGYCCFFDWRHHFLCVKGLNKESQTLTLTSPPHIHAILVPPGNSGFKNTKRQVSSRVWKEKERRSGTIWIWSRLSDQVQGFSLLIPQPAPSFGVK